MRAFADWDNETWAALRELIDDAWGRNEDDLTALAVLAYRVGEDMSALVLRGSLLSWDLQAAVEGMADIRHDALSTFARRALKETEGDRDGIDAIGKALRELGALFAKKRRGEVRPDVTADKAYHVARGMMIDIIQSSSLDWSTE